MNIPMYVPLSFGRSSAKAADVWASQSRGETGDPRSGSRPVRRLWYNLLWIHSTCDTRSAEQVGGSPPRRTTAQLCW